MRKLLRAVIPLGALAWFLVPEAAGRPSWLDRLRGVASDQTAPAGEALAEQVSRAVRTRFGRDARPSDKIHFIAPPRPLAWAESGQPLLELDEYATRIPDDGPAWRPLGSAHAGYGAVLRQVDLARVYGGVPSLREALAQVAAALKQVEPAKPDPGAVRRLRDGLEKLQQAVAAEKGKDERFQGTASRYARAFTRYLDLGADRVAGQVAPPRQAYRLSPTPQAWQRTAPPVLLSASVPAGPAAKTAAAGERIAELSAKRLGLLSIEPGDWFDADALRFLAANDLLGDAEGTRRALPRMPTMLIVASDPAVSIDLPGVRPEDVEGGSVSVLGTPREARANFRLEAGGKGAKLIYEPLTLYLVGVVSSEVHRP